MKKQAIASLLAAAAVMTTGAFAESAFAGVQEFKQATATNAKILNPEGAASGFVQAPSRYYFAMHGDPLINNGGRYSVTLTGLNPAGSSIYVTVQNLSNGANYGGKWVSAGAPTASWSNLSYGQYRINQWNYSGGFIWYNYSATWDGGNSGVYSYASYAF